MGISLPIGSHLDDSQARRTANQAEDYFTSAGRQAGEGFARNVNAGLGRVDTGRARLKAEQLQRAYDKAADAAGKLRAEEVKLAAVNASSNSTDAQKVTAAERLLRARRSNSSAVRSLTNDLRDLERAGGSAQAVLSALNSGQDLTQLGSSAAKASMSFGELATSIAAVAGPVAIGALVGGAAYGAITVLGAIGSAAVELTGALGLLPGAAVAAGAAFGTMKIATLGFGDALDDVGKSLQDFHNPKAFAEDQKKFAEDLQSLSPNAQQAALSINAMVPAFDRLKMATQDALFAGMGEQLNRLANTYLPSIQSALVSIAGSFNQAFKGIADQLMQPETQKAIQSMLSNIGQAFQNLAPAMGPVTKAFAEIANVSSSFLPGLASAITGAAQSFSKFIDEVSKSGQLHQWIQDGVDALKEFGRLGPDLKQLFMDFKVNGKTAIHDIVTVTQGLIRIVDGLGSAFGKASGEIKAMANLAVASFNVIGSSISVALQPLRELIKVNNKVNPLLTIPEIPEFKGYDLPSPGAGINPFTPKVQGNAQAVPGTYSGPGSSSSAIPGLNLATGSSPWWPTVPAYPAGGFAVPGMPDDGKKGKPPTVPLGNNDPMSLLQGFPATASLYSAASTVLDDRQKVAQAQSDLNTLEKANVRDEDAITAKRNELARAQREEHEAELRLTEAKQQAIDKSLKGLKDTHGAMQQLGAGLDQDLGISKGLPGLADNLVRFLGHLALAPQEAKWADQVDKDPRKGGYGLMGILAAQGVFGDQYTGLPPQQQVFGPSTAYPGMAPGMRGGQPYGLAPGTNTGGYGSSGAVFPAWVHALEQAFGVKASTYAGHQESDRNEPGYAPNPMHQNRGIDWTGSPQAMQAFANFMAGQPNAEQVIYQNPLTGQNTEAVAGQARPGYFAGDLSEHRGHVHTRQSYEIDPPGFSQGTQDATGALTGLASAANSATQALAGPPGGWSADWNAIAQKESGGNWGINTGNGYSGGLQFTPNSWAAAGGTQYAPNAFQATPYQQAMTGENLLAMQGPGAWPNTFTPGSAGPGAGGMYPGMGMPQGLPGVGPSGIGPVGLGSAATLGGPAVNPTQIGGLAPAAGIGKGGIGMSGGGALDMAMQAGGAALDMMAPGAGQAAQTGMKLANRAIQYGGQVAGIGVQGLMDTFLPTGGSQLAQSNWATRILGGLAGALPAIPNIAGKKAPEQAQGAQAQGAQGNTTNVTHNTTINAEGRDNGGLARDWEYNTTQAAMAPGM